MSSPIAGYLINRNGGLDGERGQAYDYILASNGLFILGKQPWLTGSALVAAATIRGLAPWIDVLDWPYGKPHASFFEAALRFFRERYPDEAYMAMTAPWPGQYSLRVPPNQEASSASVKYEPPGKIVIDFHSHGSMPAFFSKTDDADDQGFKIAIVVGRLDLPVPQVRIRLCVYGYYRDYLAWGDVFGGLPESPIDVLRGPPRVVAMHEPEAEYEAVHEIEFAGFRVPLLSGLFGKGKRKDAP